MNQQGAGRATPGGIVIIFIVLFAVIQLVPYGRNHANPPLVQEPAWDSPQTRETFFRVCKNCHSNGTEWPWYGSVAPLSWLVQSDVGEGRSKFNVSEWQRPKNKGDEAAGEVRNGDMPPWYYRPLHPEARLTAGEGAAFAQGLARTFGDAGARRKGDTRRQVSEGTVRVPGAFGPWSMSRFR